MEATLSHHLTSLSDSFSKATGMSLATLSERAAGDWRFFKSVAERTLNFRIRSYDRAVEWFSANWPEGVAWPEGVPRPETAASGEEDLA